MQNPILRFALPALLALAGCATTTRDAWTPPTLHHQRPIVIAHRGASGFRPEHTIAGYKLALEQGADCIEPDLVMTRDHVLVARHDTYLSATTDIADHPEFASRKHLSKDPEFPDRVDWWVADFTLAELKTLRAKQAFRGRSKAFDGQFQIPTFDEVLQLATTSRTKSGHPVCVYPEAKSPSYHASLGMDLADPILDTLRKYHLDKKGSPVFIQCFEPAFLKAIRPRTPLPLIMLVADKPGLDHANAYPGAPFWDGIGGTHQLILREDGTSTGVLEAEHAKGQLVHIWTYRSDAPPYKSESARDSMRRAFLLGVDGVFTDFPDMGVSVVASIADGKTP